MPKRIRRITNNNPSVPFAAVLLCLNSIKLRVLHFALALLVIIIIIII